ncbi:MAG: SDR family oxidoreductase [Acidimicrobiales bacterium]
MQLGLQERRALVTGGSKGIGYAVCRELLAEGAAVVFCARHADEVDTAAKELGGPVTGIVADVTDPAAVAALVADAAGHLGGLDILVNNAGGAHPGGFEDLSDDDWHHDLDVKLFSQIRCTRAALPHLKASRAARVVNINAVYGRYPDPAFFATSVNRAACHNLTKVLAAQYGPDRILVNSVNIGFVDTPQWENIRARRAPESTLEELFGRLAAEEVPLGRFGTTDEVSGVVAFLASDRASYITGTVIDVAGGMGR